MAQPNEIKPFQEENMPASLKLILTDAAGKDLNDTVTVDLFSLRSSQQYQAVARVQRQVVINGIDLGAGPLYRVMVTPANHRIIQFFITFTDGQTAEFSAPLPVDPQKVVSINPPSFASLN